MIDLKQRSYNAVLSLYNRGDITEEQWNEYQEQWAFAGEWVNGRYVYNHFSDFAYDLREQIVLRKQMKLFYGEGN